MDRREFAAGTAALDLTTAFGTRILVANERVRPAGSCVVGKLWLY